MTRSIAGAVLASALLGAPLARADVAQLSATFDSTLQNTVFTVTNDSTVSEAVRLVTSLGPTTTVNLPNLLADSSETYTFSQISGGFENDPASAGIPDTTTYQLQVGLNNGPITLSSAAFSPISNLTGGDVDFLGNNCNGFAGGLGTFGGTCGVTDALAGVVASVSLPVPEPRSLTVLASGLAALGLTMGRRRSSPRG